MKTMLRTSLYSLLFSGAICGHATFAAEPVSAPGRGSEADPAGRSTVRTRAASKTGEPGQAGAAPAPHVARFAAMAPSDGPVGYAVAPPFGPWIGLQGQWGDGLGWDGHNYSVRSFLPWHVDPGESLFFASLNGGVAAEHGEGFGAFGGGYRHYVEGMDRIFGLSGWFDLDGAHAQTYYRTGLSLETLGRYLDARLNTYFIVGADSIVTFDGIATGPFFQGRRILFEHQRHIESAFSGGDLEVGGRLPFLGRYGVSGYLGGYFLQSDEEADENENTVGVKVRAHTAVTEDVDVGVNYAYDDVFGANTWVNVTWRFPSGKPERWFKPRRVKERLADPVQRMNRVQTNTRIEASDVAARDPDTGLPLDVLHVDPDADSAGDGSVENPFMRMESARTANNPNIDIIYVRPRNDGTGTNLAMNAALTLLENQRLLSTSLQHTIDTQFGTFPLPGFTGGSDPLLRNLATTPSSIVILAGGDEVSGFRFDGTGGAANVFHSGITGNATNGFVFRGNTFENVVNGIAITHTGTGLGIMESNTAVGMGNPSFKGLAVEHTGGTLDLLIANNEVRNFLGEDANLNAVLDKGEDLDADLQLDEGVGIEVIATNGATVNANDPDDPDQPLGVLNNTVTDNYTGINLQTETGGVINAVLEENIVEDNVAPNTGLRVTADSGRVDLETVADNSFDSNNGSGVLLRTRNSGIITGTFLRNSFDNNTENGLFIDAETGQVDIDLADNTFNRPAAGETGLLVEALNADIAITGVRNEFIGGNANVGPGIDATVDGGTLDLDLGSSAEDDGNIFDQNAGAGVAVTLLGDAEGTLTIRRRNVVQRTADDGDPLTPFAGEGIFVEVNENAQLLNSTIFSNFIGDQNDPALGNASHGIFVAARDGATIRDLTIGNTDGDNNNGNIISNNGGDGIHFLRTVDAVIDDVTLQDNVLTDNGDDGVEIIARGGTGDLLNFHIEDNVITGNATNGINLHVQADARIDADIIDNLIDSNGANGILTTETVFTATDQRSVSGTWTGNVITNNPGHGISLNASMDGLVVGLTGTDADGESRGNLVDLNGLNGILVDASGSASFTNNTITRSGQAVPGSETQGHGVDIQGPGFKNLSFNQNVISENAEDGIEFRNNGNSGPFSFTVVADNNVIERNEGRGIDILNQGNADSSLTIDNNTIRDNAEEGVYAVNTASTTQDQAGPAPTNTNPETDPSHGMNADGSILADPNLVLNMDNNLIAGNGADSGFDGFTAANGDRMYGGTGLVLRVGTADGGYAHTATGGFADTRAGVTAEITNNTFSGNFGDDVYIESFTSTVDPADTDGTWDGTTFDINTFEGDPLARLDLLYSGNTTDSTDMNNLGAFYNNGEDTFKSRTDAETPPGPFTSGDRRRNAQRLAERLGLDPTTGPNVPGEPAEFEYPGMGQGTFRLLTGSDTGPFILDVDPYNDVTDANGVDFPPGDIFGELPYGWTGP